MIEVGKFVRTLSDADVTLFTGVPDSLLKNFCAYVTDFCADRHVIAANEGGAVALASGHYLATGKLACVYMQNSGEGNAVNPLTSLADPDVYSIPMVLLVGWRGEPGIHDEPQHAKQGKVTVTLLETLGVPTEVLPDDEYSALEIVRRSVQRAKAESRPVALVVRKGLFGEYALQSKRPDIAEARRETAIENVLAKLPSDAVVVSTTGMISREVYETRERLRSKVEVEDGGSCHARDFLTVGSMGHALMIALGIARTQPDRPVWCLDGDGASVMQMGNMAIAGQSGCGNLTHVVFNNAAHDSVGGQPTVGGEIDLRAIAKACGYEVISDLRSATATSDCNSPKFLELRVAKGARKDLGRPKEPPQVNRDLFMRSLGVK